jgi:hypothetical protein
MAVPDYPSPITVVSTTGNGLQPNILDVRNFITSRLPPVIQIYISNAATVTIRASGAISAADPPALVNYATFGNSITSSDFVDLIGGTGIFYQFFLAGNNGTVVIYALPGATHDNNVCLPQLVRMTTNATAGL